MNWMDIGEKSEFGLDNLPFGIYSTSSKARRCGVALGDEILDLVALSELGFLRGIPAHVLQASTLNDFIRLGKDKWRTVRRMIQSEFSDEHSSIREYATSILDDRSSAIMHLPVEVGDYTDFYSSKEHATNVGKMFRDPENALLPNWTHMPVGYHGRASSIVVSGHPVHRPQGQTKPPDSDTPVFGPTKRLDFELEMGFVIGRDTELGSPVSVNEAEDHIFGVLLFNDWSARDIQKWEYVPLGPFLGKSFASSISPWIVTMDALAPFRTKGPEQSPVLPYLKFSGEKNYGIELEVSIIPRGGKEQVLCRSNFKYMYWNMAQQLAHHTVNGCNVRVGDIMASGTISGPTADSFGSMLELSWGGKNPIELDGGGTRTFLEDGDTVIMRGRAVKGETRIGLGEVRTEILPAKMSK